MSSDLISASAGVLPKLISGFSPSPIGRCCRSIGRVRGESSGIDLVCDGPCASVRPTPQVKLVARCEALALSALAPARPAASVSSNTGAVSADIWFIQGGGEETARGLSPLTESPVRSRERAFTLKGTKEADTTLLFPDVLAELHLCVKDGGGADEDELHSGNSCPWLLEGVTGGSGPHNERPDGLEPLLADHCELAALRWDVGGSVRP